MLNSVILPYSSLAPGDIPSHLTQSLCAMQTKLQEWKDFV
jgi:hypothetical protein